MHLNVCYVVGGADGALILSALLRPPLTEIWLCWNNQSLRFSEIVCRVSFFCCLFRNFFTRMLYAALVSSMHLVAFAADYGGWQYQSYSYDYGDDDYAADYVTQARDKKFAKIRIFSKFQKANFGSSFSIPGTQAEEKFVDFTTFPPSATSHCNVSF